MPLTPGHVQQLHRRRCDLLDTNLDLLDNIGVEALNRVFDAYTSTITS